MKKCPICEKTFEDSMSFCQTDGTPLDDIIEETPDDPFKTMVGRPDDIFPPPPLPPDDPFKTMVAGSLPKDDTGDLLQLPEEFDSLKTAVVSPEEMREHLGENTPADASAPPSAFDETDSPLELSADESSNVSSSPPGDFPKFNEPSLNPPDFGDFSASTDASENVTEIIPPESISPDSPFSFDSNPIPPQSSAPPMSFGDSPFNSPNDASIPSPFDDAPKSFEDPSTPMPPFKEPEPPTILGSNPFDQPSPFGQSPQDPFSQPFDASAPQSGWAPPAPVTDWQDQGMGANMPFQPSAVSLGSNQTLAIVSLACGAVSLLSLVGLIIPFLNIVCLGLSVLLALGAIVTGVLAFLKASKQPDQYSGKGFAIGGIATGVVTLLVLVGFIIIAALFVGGQLRF